jgi:hypothetical protein
LLIASAEVPPEEISAPSSSAVPSRA